MYMFVIGSESNALGLSPAHGQILMKLVRNIQNINLKKPAGSTLLTPVLGECKRIHIYMIISK